MPDHRWAISAYRHSLPPLRHPSLSTTDVLEAALRGIRESNDSISCVALANRALELSSFTSGAEETPAALRVALSYIEHAMLHHEALMCDASSAELPLAAEARLSALQGLERFTADVENSCMSIIAAAAAGQRAVHIDDRTAASPPCRVEWAHFAFSASVLAAQGHFSAAQAYDHVHGLLRRESEADASVAEGVLGGVDGAYSAAPPSALLLGACAGLLDPALSVLRARPPFLKGSWHAALLAALPPDEGWSLNWLVSPPPYSLPQLHGGGGAEQVLSGGQLAEVQPPHAGSGGGGWEQTVAPASLRVADDVDDGGGTLLGTGETNFGAAAFWRGFPELDLPLLLRGVNAHSLRGAEMQATARAWVTSSQQRKRSRLGNDTSDPEEAIDAWCRDVLDTTRRLAKTGVVHVRPEQQQQQQQLQPHEQLHPPRQEQQQQQDSVNEGGGGLSAVTRRQDAAANENNGGAATVLSDATSAHHLAAVVVRTQGEGASATASTTSSTGALTVAVSSSIGLPPPAPISVPAALASHQAAPAPAPDNLDQQPSVLPAPAIRVPSEPTLVVACPTLTWEADPPPHAPMSDGPGTPLPALPRHDAAVIETGRAEEALTHPAPLLHSTLAGAPAANPGSAKADSSAAPAGTTRVVGQGGLGDMNSRDAKPPNRRDAAALICSLTFDPETAPPTPVVPNGGAAKALYAAGALNASTCGPGVDDAVKFSAVVEVAAPVEQVATSRPTTTSFLAPEARARYPPLAMVNVEAAQGQAPTDLPAQQADSRHSADPPDPLAPLGGTAVAPATAGVKRRRDAEAPEGGRAPAPRARLSEAGAGDAGGSGAVAAHNGGSSLDRHDSGDEALLPVGPPRPSAAIPVRRRGVAGYPASPSVPRGSGPPAATSAPAAVAGPDVTAVVGTGVAVVAGHGSASYTGPAPGAGAHAPAAAQLTRSSGTRPPAALLPPRPPEGPILGRPAVAPPAPAAAFATSVAPSPVPKPYPRPLAAPVATPPVASAAARTVGSPAARPSPGTMQPPPHGQPHQPLPGSTVLLQRPSVPDGQARLGRMTADALKAALRVNGMKTSGTKDELLARARDAVLRGCVPRCPVCRQGFLRQVMDVGAAERAVAEARARGELQQAQLPSGPPPPPVLVYECPGGFDEAARVRTACPARLFDVVRVPWRWAGEAAAGAGHQAGPPPPMPAQAGGGVLLGAGAAAPPSRRRPRTPPPPEPLRNEFGSLLPQG